MKGKGARQEQYMTKMREKSEEVEGRESY